MLSVSPALIPLGPALAAVVIALAGRRLGERSAVVAFAGTAIAALLAVLPAGPAFAAPGGGVLLRDDRIAAVLTVLIGVVGSAVTAFAARYLQGNTHFTRFFARSSAVTAATVVLALAADAILFALAWTAVAFALHGLLRLRAERPEARRAAGRQFRTEALGCAALLVAVVLIAARTDSTDIAHAAVALHDDPLALLAAALLVLAAMCRSALLPFGAWLTESLEAPTPVSALLHAGIVNGGAVLLCRFAPLLVAVPLALVAVACAGAISASIGLACMRVRPERKRRLAYSTLAQMGFLFVQCGAGAFGAAIVHLTGHGLYKAARFLASGEAIAEARATQLLGRAPSVRPRVACAVALVAASALFALLVPVLHAPPIVAALGWSMAVLALERVVSARLSGIATVLAAAVALGFAAAYTALAGWFDASLAIALPPAAEPIGRVLAAIIVIATAVRLIAGAFGLRAPAALRDRWYVWCLNERATLGAGG